SGSRSRRIPSTARWPCAPCRSVRKRPSNLARLGLTPGVHRYQHSWRVPSRTTDRRDRAASTPGDPMRPRERVLQSLEKVYRAAFAKAEEAGDRARMEALDLEYQQEQIRLEVLLDIRDLLASPEVEPAEEGTVSLLEKAQKIRNL